MKKFFVGLALIFCLILVSCKTEIKNYKITYHLDYENMTIEKQYSPNEVIPNINILGSSKEGYELTAWYFDNNHTEIVTFPYTVTEDKDFWAEWTRLYIVTLMNGTSTLKTEKVLAGKTFNNPGNPQITGVGTFKGWSSSKDEYVPYDFSTRIEADVVLYAFFEEPTPETITVSFMDGETLVEAKEIQKNSTVSQATAPVKTDYTFKGWSSNKDEYVEFDFETKLIENTTLYAFYTKSTEAPETVTVTFKNGNDVIDTATINKNASVESITAPTKTGYTFKGWSSKEDEFIEFDFTSKIEENISLYAFYEINTYTVTYKYNNITYTTQTATYNSVAVAPNNPIIPGYSFIEWCIDKNCETAYNFLSKITSDITLYAKLEPVTTHTLTLIIDGKQSLVLINTNSTIDTVEIPTENGYEVTWYKDSNYTTAFDSTTKITKDMTLYGKSTIKSFTVTFMDGSNPYDTKTVTYNSSLTLPANPSKEGHTFKGWSTKQNEFVQFGNTPITSNTTLYAFYTINTYTVTFKDGNTVLSTNSVNYNSTVPLPTAQNKTGYTFKGWSSKANEFIKFDANTKIKVNTTIYAIYEIQTFTVKFMDATIELSKDTVEYNSTAAFPTAPTKSGYIFKGWSTKQNEFTVFDSETKITANTTIYAYYIQVFTVTFNVDGTKTTSQVEEGNKVKEPENPTKSGYTFTGWYLEDSKFNFNTPITANIELIANFKNNQDASIEIKNFGGYNEGLFFEATPLADATISDYKVQYKSSTSSTWTSVDSDLIRVENSLIRCDVVGLQAGPYQVKVDVLGKSITFECQVVAYDRSGYAHFNYSSGIGAYNDDGTLKSNAIVVYVTNETKNTVTVSGYTGLVNIIQNQKKIGKPLDIRIIGRISTNQYKTKSNEPRLTANKNNHASDFFTNVLETTYGENLVGLTVQYMDKVAGKSYKFLTTETKLQSNGTGSSTPKTTTYKGSEYPSLYGEKVYDDDSYFNMLDIDSASNITIEGIGTNAEFFQFGLTWKKCNSIEVRNITFTDYPEDACSFEAGSNSDVNTYGHYWIHHNTFNRGKNNWDISGERDKYAGDGGIDVKYINSVTLSYNKFNNCKKTGLVGGSNENYTKNITFHHNYYYKVESRLPLGRQANMHIYNNYYEDCSTCQDIRANAFVFSEANYFKNCDYPQKVTAEVDDKGNDYTGTVIKSFGDYYDSSCGSSQATTVSSRTQTLSGNCKPDGSKDYTNFDVDSSLFYYAGGASNVAVLHKNAEVPDYCKTYSGVLKNSTSGGGTITPTPDPDPQPPVESWTNKLTEDFSVIKPIQQFGKDDSIPTGISYYTDATDNSKNNVTIESGSLHINDTSASTTWGYYMFDTVKLSLTGKVRISVDFVPPKSSSKWTIIQFMDGENNIFVRTDGDKKLGYNINGESVINTSTNKSELVVHSIDSTAMVANKTYTIVLTIDYSSNGATISINGGTSVKLTGYTANKAIYGLGFMTAGSDMTRSYTVDNIIVDWYN